MSEHKALKGFHDWRTARHREASRIQWPPRLVALRAVPICLGLTALVLATKALSLCI